MSVKILSVSLVWLFVGASALSQAPTEQQKKYQQLEKVVNEALVNTAAEIPQLKMPENRIYLRTVIADLQWRFDEKNARAMITESREELWQLMANSEENSPQSYAFTARQQLRRELVNLLAKRDADLALEFLRATRPVFPPNADAKQAGDAEAQLEQALAREVARTNPQRALALAEESLEKGFSYELNNLVTTVLEKDNEAGKKLAAKIHAKLKKTDLLANQSAMQFAIWFLTSEQNARKTELSPGEKMYGIKHRAPVLTEPMLREFCELIGKAALTMMNKALQTRDGDNRDLSNWLSNFFSVLPTLESYNPPLAASVKRTYAELRPYLNHWVRENIQFNEARQTGKVEDLLALAEKAQGEKRDQVLWQVIHQAIDAHADFELARKIANEMVTDPVKRKEQIAFIDWVYLQHAAGQGKLEEALAALSSLASDEDRIESLASLAADLLKKKDRKHAAQVMERAVALLPAQIETERHFRAVARLLAPLAETESERSFALYEQLVVPVNELHAAYIRIQRYNVSSRWGYMANGEFVVFGHFGSVSQVIQPPLQLGALAKVDFERAFALAENFKAPEVRLAVKVAALQSVLSQP